MVARGGGIQRAGAHREVVAGEDACVLRYAILPHTEEARWRHSLAGQRVMHHFESVFLPVRTFRSKRNDCTVGARSALPDYVAYDSCDTAIRKLQFVRRRAGRAIHHQVVVDIALARPRLDQMSAKATVEATTADLEAGDPANVEEVRKRVVLFGGFREQGVVDLEFALRGVAG